MVYKKKKIIFFILTKNIFKGNNFLILFKKYKIVKLLNLYNNFFYVKEKFNWLATKTIMKYLNLKFIKIINY